MHKLPCDRQSLARALQGKSYLLIEFCCDAESILGKTAPSSALVFRITEQFDAVSNEAALIKLADDAAALNVPTALWSSIPCTGGTQWQIVNVAKFGVTEKLKNHWKLFTKLWKVFERVANAVMQSRGLIAIEWPLRCGYWQDKRVKRFLAKAECQRAVAAACMFGMRPQRQHADDEYIGKSWRVSTTSTELANALDVRCDGRHRHVIVQGGETSASSFYPERFADTVHKSIMKWTTQRNAEGIMRQPTAATSSSSCSGRVPHAG